jgi:hypothetical protein
MNKLITALAAVGVACAFVPATATADPPSGVCPPGNSGFVLWDVDTQPYGVDNLVDDRGNADGWACAQPGDVVLDEEGNPFQLYNFIDNRVGRP